MYDNFSLPALLEDLGHKNIIIQTYNLSKIPSWERYGLDINKIGQEYKPGSLCVEAQK